ncbi:DUF6443 domain-containing protein [Chitinophaga sancti]|uniref:DUF6443 domain-containing protein n=1 Tax=Chitinophaga sancti TaxID=1004 RepID=A0A1K1SZ68_9BACT|nr:DUF6443 domain-containing protein [Chitinophaga sancti]WQD63940.1 DUF6443 domain-containing protein [Chitinophaga sancti]WQG90435.1 DUF6443 domain-containing protein [Chitinophaga sancti]SFW89375.1 RHS repeat-associated core domain-containing protein [Chitinophaga sancti]
MSVKHKLILPGALLCSLVTVLNVYGQTPDGSLPNTGTAVTIPAAYTNGIPNYIRTWVPAKPIQDPTFVNSTSNTVRDVRQMTDYLDGLGRLVQTVNKGYSGTGSTIANTGKDFVIPKVYDVLDRETYVYLPYIQQDNNTSDGNLKTDPFNAQSTFYKNAILNPGSKDETIFYMENEYDGSPLNRINRTFNVGNTWSRAGGAKAASVQYLYNKVADSVRIWRIAAGVTIPASNSFYAAGQLSKTVSIDENGNTTVFYTDKEDRVILKKVQKETITTAHGGWLCTYYVYNELGSLSFVIPPLVVQRIMGNWMISGSLADGMCYQYTYDEYTRNISRKTPGSGETQLVYDNFDRPVFVQTAAQRVKTTPEWQFTFYNDQNRATVSGTYPTGSTRDQLQQQMTATASTTRNVSYSIPQVTDLVLDTRVAGITGYIARGSITLNPEFTSEDGANFDVAIDPTATTSTIQSVVEVNTTPNITGYNATAYDYYDDYNYAGAKPFASADVSSLDASSDKYPVAVNPNTYNYGMATGSKINVLGTNQWLITSTYFDNNGRPVQTRSDNAVGGETTTTAIYSFNGNLLSDYTHITNPRSAATPDIKVVTSYTYDHEDRLKEITKKLNNSNDLTRVVATNDYDDLGRLRTKWIGKKTDGTYMDSQTFDYNLRGWVKAINSNYVNTSGSTSNWFGQDISYDYGFSTKQYNGNIAGEKWKSKSNGIARAFGYSYDNTNSMTGAEFNQQNSGNTAWTKDQADFTMSNMSYDANGNLLSLNRQGLKNTTVASIDKLQYSYLTGTNQLRMVIDNANDASSTLGDFKEPDANHTSNTSNPDNDVDYQYDANGNLVVDKNKGIESTTYNFLNLPELITFTGKGTIQNVYDANGLKLKTIVTDNTVSPAVVTTTDYITGAIYKNDVPVSVDHETGRIRAIVQNGQTTGWTYDYFEKDYQGNIRMVLTEQTDLSIYAATMETASATIETALFSNVDETRTETPVGYPEDHTTVENAKVAKLNAKQGGKKIGPSLVLRVMAGDTIRIRTKAFYKSDGPANQHDAPLDDMVVALANAFTPGSNAGDMHNVANNTGTPFNYNFKQSWKDMRKKDPELAGRPKAYLNYVLFDEQMKMVDNNSGYKQVQNTPDALQDLAVEILPVSETGLMYIYTSNETATDVYFDNTVVSLSSGPLLEETHYYPFGLLMDGISSNVLKGTTYERNNYKYGGKQLKSGEFSDGSGLELYDFAARQLDPQLGRWNSPDPLSDEGTDWTPYRYGFNNPMRYTDPTGLFEVDGEGNLYFSKDDEISKLLEYVTANPSGSFGDIFKFVTDSRNGFVWDLPEVVVRGNNDKAWQDARNQIYNEVADALKLLGGGPEAPATKPKAKANKAASALPSTLSPDQATAAKMFKGITFGDKLDINLAIAHLWKNKEESPNHQCAKYLREGLEAGGMNTTGRPRPAEDYGPFLLAKGFKFVTSDITNYTPVRGDIAVMQSFTLNGKYTAYGHIQMYTGTAWVSDFANKVDFWPGSGYRTAKPPTQIFRW